jgi:hypothetical protein
MGSIYWKIPPSSRLLGEKIKTGREEGGKYKTNGRKGKEKGNKGKEKGKRQRKKEKEKRKQEVKG